jgi:hypothetical protein
VHEQDRRAAAANPIVKASTLAEIEGALLEAPEGHYAGHGVSIMLSGV